MSDQIEVRISMSAQRDYEKAVVKYGEVYAEAVVASELQMFADSLDCFDEYLDVDGFPEMVEQKEVKNE